MISYLNGTVAEKQPTRVVLDVAGVGYEALIPLSSYDRLPAAGEPCHLLTHMHVREDAHILFGFMTDGERRMFSLLLSASGVGPKLALSALSGLSVRDLKSAIVGGDIKRLSSISGIGRKLAERIVVDLKDKISDAEALEATAGAETLTPAGSKTRDALLALIALGYKQEAARKMLQNSLGAQGAGDLSVEEIVRKALAS
jgi:Holliday junction DNA helicase RuvA